MQPLETKDRRPSLAFAVFLIFLMVWMQVRACDGSRAQRPPPGATGADAAADAAKSGAHDPDAGASAEVAPEATSGVGRDDEIVVETDVLRARLTNHGAALVELRLKEFFKDGSVRGDPQREADPDHWLPVVAEFDAAAPAALLRRNPAGAATGALALDTSNWVHRRSPTDAGEEIAFELADGDGHRFEKIFRFARGRHGFELELRFHGESEGPSQGTSSYLLLGASGIWDERPSPFASPPAAVVTTEDDGELDVRDASDLEDGKESMALRREDGRPFFGAVSNYFAIAFAPDEASAGLVDGITCERILDPFRLEKERAARVGEGGSLAPADERALREESLTNVRAEAALRVHFPAGGSPPLSMRFDVFAGPRGPQAMADPREEPFHLLYEVEYGGWTSLRWINRLLLAWMRVLHSLVGNWGFAIILLTVTVKVLLFPLNRLQSRTMEQFQKKMKLLQPKLEELKKKHKNNLQKLNAEQQKIMREHGVRPPVFGCLVIFLQMPVWFGLFQLMRSAPELRQQPFLGWITDLSAPDVVPLPFSIPIVGSLHLLPILMVIAWLVQNRMMPKPADPQQASMQKMMNLFPFIFGVMLYKYAAGQSLYMLTNSLLGMLQMKLLKVTPTS